MTRWDAIVVGSGLGGLTTAAYLATNGLRTLVLEQYDVAGGCSHVFRRKRRYEFDVGLHYIGDCGPSGTIPTVLRGVGAGDKVTFLEMDPDGFDTLVFPGFDFRVPRGWDRYLDRLIAAFPDDEAGLRRCVEVLRRMPLELARVQDLPPDELARLLELAPTVAEWGLRTLAELYDACELGEGARAVLSGQSVDYGTPPSRAAVSLHAGLIDHYVRGGAWYPQGGGQVLAGHLVDVIQAHGGRVRTRARVEEIELERGRVRGVRLRGGERLEAEVVVSNADIKRTFLELIRPEELPPESAERVERYRMAMPLFMVYLGVDIDLGEVMPRTNYWCHGELDPELAYERCQAGAFPDDPRTESLMTYITSASVKDPYSAHLAPPGHSTLEALTLAPADYGYWGVDDGPAAGERYRRKGLYRERKQRLTEALVARTIEAIPEIEGHVVWQEASTPITQERYTLSSDGACYGLEFSPEQIGPNRPQPETEIEGLYLAGASTVYCHGIMGSMRGGVGTASAVLGRDLYGEVKAGGVFGDPSLLRAGGEGWDPLEACRRLSDKPARSKRAARSRAAREATRA